MVLVFHQKLQKFLFLVLFHAQALLPECRDFPVQGFQRIFLLLPELRQGIGKVLQNNIVFAGSLFQRIYPVAGLFHQAGKVLAGFLNPGKSFSFIFTKKHGSLLF